MAELEGLMAASGKSKLNIDLQQQSISNTNSPAKNTNNNLRNTSLRMSTMKSPSLKSSVKNEINDNDDPDVALNKMRDQMIDNKLSEFKIVF